jgi:hypothetical protein
MVEFTDPDARVLPIWCENMTDETWKLIAAAIRELNINFKIKPVKAVPGSPGIILAIGSRPEWVCDGYALVEDPHTDGLRVALDVILNNRHDARIVTDLKILQRFFGAEVKILEDEDE